MKKAVKSPVVMERCTFKEKITTERMKAEGRKDHYGIVLSQRRYHGALMPRRRPHETEGAKLSK
jgi:hypothetical protein